MDVVPVTLEVPKESKEIVDAVAELVADIKAGKSISAIAAENLPSMVVAVEGYEKVAGELSSDKKADAAGYMAKRFVEVL